MRLLEQAHARIVDGLYDLREWTQDREGFLVDVAHYAADEWLNESHLAAFAQCAYYTEGAVCTGPGDCFAVNEPQCMTGQPAEGWPDPPSLFRLVLDLPSSIRQAWENQR